MPLLMIGLKAVVKMRRMVRRTRLPQTSAQCATDCVTVGKSVPQCATDSVTVCHSVLECTSVYQSAPHPPPGSTLLIIISSLLVYQLQHKNYKNWGCLFKIYLSRWFSSYWCCRYFLHSCFVVIAETVVNWQLATKKKARLGLTVSLHHFYPAPPPLPDKLYYFIHIFPVLMSFPA